MRLAEDPGRFLSTVQIGLTLVGVLSGAFSGATLGARLSEWLGAQGFSPSVSDTLGVGIVVVIITYLSLILGELVPKQVALRDPERVAARVAPAMSLLSKIGAPLVFLLDVSGKAVLRLLGQKGESEERVTEEEVRTIIAEAETAGVLERDEREMIAGVMRLADRSARALMTPRREVEVIDLEDSAEEIREQLRATRRSRLPVQDGEADSIVGVVVVKDLIEFLQAGDRGDLRALVQEAPIVMDTADSLHVLREIRASRVHMALVFDEYGHFEGIITPGDVLEAIIGAFQEEEEDEPAIVTRADGSYLVAGWMQVDEFSHELGIPIPRDADFQTVAGFILAEMNHLPNVGESFDKGHWRFEVVDLDGRRIDKILVTRIE
jgi:putative hemolysin